MFMLRVLQLQWRQIITTGGALEQRLFGGKYNSSGTLQWQKFYGRDYNEWGSGSYRANEDRFGNCCALYDGRFAAIGATYNNAGGGYIYASVMLTVWNMIHQPTRMEQMVIRVSLVIRYRNIY